MQGWIVTDQEDFFSREQLEKHVLTPAEIKPLSYNCFCREHVQTKHIIMKNDNAEIHPVELKENCHCDPYYTHTTYTTPLHSYSDLCPAKTSQNWSVYKSRSHSACANREVASSETPSPPLCGMELHYREQGRHASMQIDPEKLAHTQLFSLVRADLLFKCVRHTQSVRRYER